MGNTRTLTVNFIILSYSSIYLELIRNKINKLSDDTPTQASHQIPQITFCLILYHQSLRINTMHHEDHTKDKTIISYFKILFHTTLGRKDVLNLRNA